MKLKEIKQNWVIQELLDIAKEYDVEVRFSYSKHRKGGVFFLREEKKSVRSFLRKPFVMVYPHYDTKIEQVIFSLAHELVHFAQYTEGRYKNYYLLYPTNLGVAMRAELECDRLALGWVHDYNSKYKIKRYKVKNIWCYEEIMDERYS